MTSDADDSLSWEGDDDHQDRTDPDGVVVDQEEPPALSTPMLLLVGIVGGIYLLYTIGWIIGGFRLQVGALFLIPNVMYQIGVWAAVLAPALWFTAVWVLTRRSASWQRIVWLLVGAVLLVPWPFVMTGAVGA